MESFVSIGASSANRHQACERLEFHHLRPPGTGVGGRLLEVSFAAGRVPRRFGEQKITERDGQLGCEWIVASHTGPRFFQQLERAIVLVRHRVGARSDQKEGGPEHQWRRELPIEREPLLDLRQAVVGLAGSDRRGAVEHQRQGPQTG